MLISDLLSGCVLRLCELCCVEALSVASARPWRVPGVGLRRERLDRVGRVLGDVESGCEMRRFVLCLCMSWSLLDAESVVRCGVECGEGFSREEQTAGCGAGAFERLRGEPLS